MAICSEEFRAALRQWASGVTVVTTKDRDGNLLGITVSSFASVSLEPPLVLICIDKNTVSHYAFIESRAFIINILSENQQHISQRFASPLPNKFVEVEFTEGLDGIAVLSGSLASLECRLVLSYEGGDHTIFIGEIENATVRSGKPLLYFDGNYGKLTKINQ